MAKIYFERRGVRESLEAFLTSRGWTGLDYTEGWDITKELTNPSIGVEVMDVGPVELGLGTGPDDAHLYNRQIQVDAYMEQESRVRAILDDISDWMQFLSIPIEDANGNELGYMVSYIDTVATTVFPPVMNDPAVIRWRGIATVTIDAYYE